MTPVGPPQPPDSAHAALHAPGNPSTNEDAPEDVHVPGTPMSERIRLELDILASELRPAAPPAPPPAT